MRQCCRICQEKRIACTTYRQRMPVPDELQGGAAAVSRRHSRKPFATHPALTSAAKLAASRAPARVSITCQLRHKRKNRRKTPVSIDFLAVTKLRHIQSQLCHKQRKEMHKSASKHTKKQNKTTKSRTAHPKAQKSKKRQKLSTRIQTQGTAQKCRTEHRYWKKPSP